MRSIRTIIAKKQKLAITVTTAINVKYVRTVITVKSVKGAVILIFYTNAMAVVNVKTVGIVTTVRAV